MRLICFAPAGGSARGLYGGWARELGPTIEVCPVELPGRGRRPREPVITELQPLLADVLELVLPLTDRPYAIFGHSFGAVLALETAQRLSGSAQPRGPAALFVAGRRAPDLAVRDRFNELTDTELIRALTDLGGIPAELLAVPSVLQLGLPALRADLRISANYRWQGPAEIRCPVAALTGDADPLVERHEVGGWAKVTTGAFVVDVMRGGHYFVQHQPSVVEVVRRRLHEFALRRVPNPAARSSRFPPHRPTAAILAG
jgi:surfactin synthase thioesterase subunit